MIKFKEKKAEGGIQIGTSSLVLIFVILALTVFAVLSLTRVLADDRLSDRSADWAAEYYEADCRAEEMLADISRSVAQAVESGKPYEDGLLDLYFLDEYDEATGIASFSVPINDTMSLEVEAIVLATPRDCRYYAVSKWQEVYSSEYEIDESMPVWDGTFEE